MNVGKIDFQAINSAALADSGFLPKLLPGGRFIGPEYVALNPTRADSRPGSFKINGRTGAWSDFATGDSGGDLIDLCGYVRGLPDMGAAAREVASMVGVPIANGHNGTHYSSKPALDEWQLVLPVPEDAPVFGEKEARKFCPAGYRLVALYPYPDSNGHRLTYAARYEKPKAATSQKPDKIFYSFTYWERSGSGGGKWQCKALPEKRPL
jgi:hypothetical protein